TYNRLILGSFVLGRKMVELAPDEKNIGLLLPNANGATVAFFGLQAYGRTPAMLNFTAGPKNMLAACNAAELKTVFTSHAFVEQAGLDSQVEELAKSARIFYLENLREEIGTRDKLVGMVSSVFARWAHSLAAREIDADSASVILFTSGSEGHPKGVVLSHRNLNANCHQIAACIDFSPRDTAFNALPIFHAFGLTGGLLLPVLSGVKTFLYPSPLHYRAVPELIYDTNATIMFGTDTFLAGYARMANAYDFYSMRYVVAGAEAVKDETRKVWMERFGLRILEGYGATETSPVLALNTPMHNKPGTVGRLLPGIQYRIEPVEGIDEGGRLFVRGPNVMSGYVKTSKPGELEPPPDGWYDTGDIVSEDDEGFIKILGRAKRFAKIAGEMVPLGAVEAAVAAHWPDHGHVIVKMPDARKGEKLLLVTSNEKADRKSLSDLMKKSGLPELWVPWEILHVDEIPLLGSGKTDYGSAEALAAKIMAK
ncbi:MAG: AMP-binding protein, partial [Hyphomicrobiales bacterium]